MITRCLVTQKRMTPGVSSRRPQPYVRSGQLLYRCATWFSYRSPQQGRTALRGTTDSGGFEETRGAGKLVLDGYQQGIQVQRHRTREILDPERGNMCTYWRPQYRRRSSPPTHTYDQRRGDIRPAQKADWDGIMVVSRLSIAGDMNAHSALRNPRLAWRSNVVKPCYTGRHFSAKGRVRMSGVLESRQDRRYSDTRSEGRYGRRFEAAYL
jgi:hypothetical protein